VATVPISSQGRLCSSFAIKKRDGCVFSCTGSYEIYCCEKNCVLTVETFDGIIDLQLITLLRSRVKEYLPITGLADFNKLSAKLIFGADRCVCSTSTFN
jgi:aspartate/tyrosine/aromatic aminotransferase